MVCDLFKYSNDALNLLADWISHGTEASRGRMGIPLIDRMSP